MFAQGLSPLVETYRLGREEDMAVVAQELELIRLGHQDMNGALRGMFGPYMAIDEMALLFLAPSTANDFIRFAVRHEGYRLFNTADDVVRTSPLRSEYLVHYWFLETPHGYRLELMVPHEGSPLHDLSSRGMGPKDFTHMHASFKVQDEEQYAVVNGVLTNAGYENVQKCDSTYGRFGYWQPGLPEQMVEGKIPVADWYLKPRLNVRDASSSLTQAEERDETRAAGE